VPPGVQPELKAVCEVPLRLRMRCNGGVTSCTPPVVLLRDFVRETVSLRATEQYKWKQPPEPPPRERQVGKSDLPESKVTLDGNSKFCQLQQRENTDVALAALRRDVE
jgi:hypothetical protein